MSWKMGNTTFNFLEDVSRFVKDEIKRNSIGNTPRLALIDPEYQYSDYPNVLPRVLFDGESTMTDKRYSVASTYHPYPGDRVILIPINGSYVIMNSLTPGAHAMSGGLRLSSPDFEYLAPGSEETTSTTFTDLTTLGPRCILDTGTSAMVVLTARCSASSATSRALMGVEISEASSIAPDISLSLRINGSATGVTDVTRCSVFHVFNNLTPGTNVFTAKYAAENGTARFDQRSLFVQAL